MTVLFEVERPQMGPPRNSVSVKVVLLRPLKKAMAFAMLVSASHLLMGT